MNNVVGYYVFDGRMWLGDDEKHWSTNFNQVAEYATWSEAEAAAKRAVRPDVAYYVFALMHSYD